MKIVNLTKFNLFSLLDNKPSELLTFIEIPYVLPHPDKRL